MINLSDFNSFYAYKNSFEDFARDFFHVETTQDMTGALPEITGPEELIIAHLCYNLLLDAGKTYMVACPNQRLAHYWCQRVCYALAELPEYMMPGIKRERQDQISTGTGNVALFRAFSPNTGRGMTVQNVYVIEPQLAARRTYEEFFHSIYPVMASGKNRQLFRYSRGY